MKIEAFTPKKIIRKTSFPVWFSNELKSLVIKKKILHKRYKTTLSITDLETFRCARRECDRLSKLCHSSYISRVESSIPLNMNAFWNHVNGLKGSSGVPSCVYYDSTEASDAPSKCSLFAKFFASVFSRDCVQPPVYDYGLNLSIPNCSITALDIQHRLEALDPKKSAGPDGIPPIVLKYCAPVLAPHLCIFFKSLISAGIFPSSLKTSYVIPIFKSGDKSDVKNYRPIAIQPTLAKVFESIILDHLYFQLCDHICLEQHGFMRGRSTTTNLLIFQEFVMSAFAESSQVDSIYLDFSKAFDKINHRLLIAKLDGYGICGPLLEWLESYLRDRLLVVKCDDATSEPFPVLSGVPQGSHLGPALFLLFINDISKVISSNFLLFADDVKIFSRINSTQDHEALQQTLNNIVTWCTSNAMELNVSKCCVMTFSRGGQRQLLSYNINGACLRREDKIKDLGVMITPTLSPNEHIIHITAKASSLLGFVFRQTKDFKSPHTLVTLYKAMVRPLLEFNSIIWSPYQRGHIESLNKVQTRFIRMLGLRLGFRYFDTPIAMVETQFGMLNLEARRKFLDLQFLFKLVNGHIYCPSLLCDVDFAVPRATRSRSFFTRRYQHTNYALHHGMSRLLRTGGDMAVLDFFGVSVSSFKANVLKQLTQ